MALKKSAKMQWHLDPGKPKCMLCKKNNPTFFWFIELGASTLSVDNKNFKGKYLLICIYHNSWIEHSSKKQQQQYVFLRNSCKWINVKIKYYKRGISSHIIVNFSFPYYISLGIVPESKIFYYSNFIKQESQYIIVKLREASSPIQKEKGRKRPTYVKKFSPHPQS